MSEGACDVRRLLSSKKGEDGEGGFLLTFFIAICVKINLLLRNNIYFLYLYIYCTFCIQDNEDIYSICTSLYSILCDG